MTTTLAHNGLPTGIGRFELLRVFEQVARPGFGLSSTAVCLVRHYVLKTMDADFASGRICAVWTQACRIAAKLGLTPRSINSAERELEQAGFIVRTGGINGGRGGDRHDGVIAWAAGINLAPLVNRFSELRAKAEAIELATMAILQCRAEICQLGKRIRDIGDQALWDDVARILPGGRTARISDIRRLTAIRDALSAMLDAIESEPCASMSSDAPEENGAPKYRITNQHESVLGDRAIRWIGSRRPPRSAWRPRLTETRSLCWAEQLGPTWLKPRGAVASGSGLGRAPGAMPAIVLAGSARRFACC